MATKDFAVKNGLVVGANNATFGNAVTIASNGNFGIGTSTPSFTFENQGTTYFGANVYTQSNSSFVAGSNTIYFNPYTATTSVLQGIANGVNRGSCAVIEYNGVTNGAGPGFYATRSYSNTIGAQGAVPNNVVIGQLGFSASDGNTFAQCGAIGAWSADNFSNNYTPTNMRFVVNSGNATVTPMYILANGNIGVNTSAPLKKFSIKSTTANVPQLHLEQENATDGWDFTAGSSAGYLSIDRFAGGVLTSRIFVTQSGNVGISNTSPTHTLSVGGNINVTGNATFTNTVNVTGATTISNTVSVTGSINYTGSLVKSTVTQQTIETGTRMVFQQTAAPTGFTKDTGYNDYAMRIVSGAVSYQGGASGFNTVFASRGITGTVDGTTLSTSQIPSHTHSIGKGDRVGPGSMVGFGSNDAYGYTNIGYTGGGGSHNHSFSTSLNMAVNYIDFILATAN